MVELLTSHLESAQIRPLRRAEYDRLVDMGVFDEEKLELLRGVIISMSPQGPKHAAVIQRLNMILTALLGAYADVRIQSPVAASDVSEPEPDVAVVEKGDYLEDHPHFALLVIEVAASSQRTDRHIKATIYAGCDIPEYWLVDLTEGLVEVRTSPGPGDTGYGQLVSFQRGDAIRLHSFPDISVSVSDFLPV